MPRKTKRKSEAWDLLVTFQREGEQDTWEIYTRGDEALKGALIMMLMMDELRVGDCLIVERHRRK
jgi:hypothetical protein